MGKFLRVKGGPDAKKAADEVLKQVGESKAFVFVVKGDKSASCIFGGGGSDVLGLIELARRHVHKTLDEVDARHAAGEHDEEDEVDG